MGVLRISKGIACWSSGSFWAARVLLQPNQGLTK